MNSLGFAVTTSETAKLEKKRLKSFVSLELLDWRGNPFAQRRSRRHMAERPPPPAFHNLFPYCLHFFHASRCKATHLISPPALFIVNFSSALPHAETEAELMKAALMERKRLQPGETSYDRVSLFPSLALACVSWRRDASQLIANLANPTLIMRRACRSDQNT